MIIYAKFKLRPPICRQSLVNRPGRWPVFTGFHEQKVEQAIKDDCGYCSNGVLRHHIPVRPRAYRFTSIPRVSTLLVGTVLRYLQYPTDSHPIVLIAARLTRTTQLGVDFWSDIFTWVLQVSHIITVAPALGHPLPHVARETRHKLRVGILRWTCPFTRSGVNMILAEREQPKINGSPSSKSLSSSSFFQPLFKLWWFGIENNNADSVNPVPRFYCTHSVPQRAHIGLVRRNIHSPPRLRAHGWRSCHPPTVKSAASRATTVRPIIHICRIFRKSPHFDPENWWHVRHGYSSRPK